MQKTVTLTDIEQHIELLAPGDQLKLLEKIVRHFRQSLTGQANAKRKNNVASSKPESQRGALKQYANPSLVEKESSAFISAMKEKHAFR